ncbi:hypothetical protein [Singulisphaera acidiphila]|uniref:Peptidase C39-like domain-containing protein n=1 Tax=Singulisphaera acidiphila (strain ATCC BAA-1392 / DSM 18658 / VKM B-2454 / MOB10) TaxID=886293 RepID=L0DEX2_SINAD|nr:hypothetical protein [Singulisphaera acidiphila]AGA27358.1 hypothetical protein Sinac_3077 [Singulisphaera acidiphila DSM 18658]
MAWFSRVSRFGDVHWVFGQEQQISCGVACVIMAAFKINKIAPGTKALFSEADILAKATAMFGPNPLGTAGFNNPQILQMLNHADLKMTGWNFKRLAKPDVPDKIIQEVGVTSGFGVVISVKPMIVGIDWKGGGGHWVVVDTVRTFMGKKYATVCDPWDANLHIVPLKKNQTFSYTGKSVVGVDFWGERYNYDTPSEGGAFLGDVLWRA